MTRVGCVAVGVLLAAAGASIALGAAAPTGYRVKDNLYATKFISATEGWAVGAFGLIVHTTDGGKSWQPQPSKTTEPLFSVDFSDAKNGVAVGRSGVIVRTTDGGETWSEQPSGSKHHLFSVAYADPQKVLVVGDWGTVLVSADGGATWKSEALDKDVILNDVFMLDRTNGWIVGEVGTVLATNDGGQTWVERENPIGKTLYGVFFADATHGWAVGLDGLILHSADGGATWDVQHGNTELGALEQVQFSQSVENPSLYAVKVMGDKGVAVGESGAVFVSNDAGRSWKRQPPPESWPMGWLRDVSISPDARGAIVGAEGRIVLIDQGRIDFGVEE